MLERRRGGRLRRGRHQSRGDYVVTCSEGTRTCSGGKWGACVGTVKVIKSTGSIRAATSVVPRYYSLQGTPGATDAGASAPATRAIALTCSAFTGNRQQQRHRRRWYGLAPDDAGTGWTLPLSSRARAGTCS